MNDKPKPPKKKDDSWQIHIEWNVVGVFGWMFLLGLLCGCVLMYALYGGFG